MIRLLRTSALCFGMMTSSCVAQTPPVAHNHAATVNFAEQIQPLLNERCVACHQDAGPSGGLSLQRKSVLANLVGVPSTGAAMPRVNPGDPGKSYILFKLRGDHASVGGSGTQMPPSGAPLSADEIALIAAWIANYKAP